MASRLSILLLTLLITLITTSAALAQNRALIIGNDDYDPSCASDLPGVVPDTNGMAAALGAAGWQTTIVRNVEAAAIQAAILNNKPAEGKKYIIYYAGHGDNNAGQAGQWLGPNCSVLTPAMLVGTLGANASRTLVILDSCGGGEFADQTNAIEPAICFVTSTTDLQCAGKGGSGGLFTQCFLQGLNGAADQAPYGNGDGQVTLQEAWDYANANCRFAGQDPTWDGGCGDCVIGSGPVPVAPATWGTIKAIYQ